MSKQFAEQVLALTDQNQIRDLISHNKGDVDNSFVSHLLDISDVRKQEKKYEAALNILRIIFIAGQITEDFYISAFSLLRGAYLEIARRDFNQAIRMISRCISECDKSVDTRCVEIKAKAYHLQGELQFQQYDDANAALRSLQSAVQLYERLGKNEQVERVHSSIEKINLHVKQGSKSKPLGDVLDEIVESRELLHSLQREIEARHQQLIEIQRQHSEIEKIIAELEQNRVALSNQNIKIKEQIDHLQQTLHTLRTQVSLLATAREVPLWIAAVRADIARGEISKLTLPLLEHMRMSEPHYAAPLIAEIRARNASSPETLFDLSELSGEARLFGGIANSFALEADNPLAAVEAILEAWETFLNNISGSAH
ncbi:hypothetical protein VZO05_07810 [Aggregatilineales bacterium SYSU G02658]